MRVLFTFEVSEEERAELEQFLPDQAQISYLHDLTDEEKERAYKNTEIVIGGRLSDDQLKKMNSLKFHQTFATGIDRHNLAYYKENNIILCNNHSHADIIAEYAFVLMLSIAKNIVANDQMFRKGLWDPYKHKAVTLYNKKVLFLGYGAIAQEIKKLCKPFDVKFMAVKKTTSKVKDVEIFLSTQKRKALKNADFIVNTLPLTDETRDFLNTADFEIMKDTAYVVNVGRGATINEKALYEALKEKRIAGAGIDVWYNYPKSRASGKKEPVPCYPSEYPFDELDNIVMTAHRAWVSDMPWFENTKEIVRNVARYMKGKEPKNIVDLNEGY